MTVIKIKNSNVSGRLPASGDIEIAELALNIADQKLYSKDAAGSIFEIGVAGDIPSGIAPPSSGNNNGDLYFDTSTARLLYWDGSGWQTVVKVSGDNFTGDVTLGTDKITLDATAGNASFDGTIRVNDSSGDAQTYLQNDGSINVAWGQLSSGLSTYISGASGKHYIGWDPDNSANTKILFDPEYGTASFAGEVEANGGLEAYIPTNNLASFSQRWFDNRISTRGLVATMGVGGQFWARNSLSVGGTSANDYAAAITNEGAADFAGPIQIGENAITLNADGTATFTGGIRSGGDAYAGGAEGVLINGGPDRDFPGSIDVCRDGATQSIWKGWLKDTGTSTSLITAGGDATFQGTVTATVVPPSDARFKENIEPAKPQLADVVALGGLLKNYDWNDQAPLNEEIRSQRQLGLIAQEVAEVCPFITKNINRTKRGAMLTPEEIIPAVVEPAYTIPAVTKEISNPKAVKEGETITIEVKPAEEVPEKVITPEKVIPATYEVLDDSYQGISSEALIMKLIGAVAELSAEVTALKAAKLTKK